MSSKERVEREKGLEPSTSSLEEKTSPETLLDKGLPAVSPQKRQNYHRLVAA